MKSGAIAAVLAGFVVVVGITYSFIREKGASIDQKLPFPTKADVSSGLVQVDDLAKAPELFKGDIVLRAVVAGVNKPQGVFGVIDAREYEKCGSLSCCEKEILPVKFAGNFPDPKTFVQITGRVVRDEKGLVFEAKGLEVMP